MKDYHYMALRWTGRSPSMLDCARGSLNNLKIAFWGLTLYGESATTVAACPDTSDMFGNSGCVSKGVSGFLLLLMCS